METFNELLARENSAAVQALTAEWTAAYKECERQKETMKQVEQRIVQTAAHWKPGDVLKVERDGKRVVVVKVELNTFFLRTDTFNKEPTLKFSYTYRNIKKDGQLSLNNSLYNEGELEPTGEKFNLEDGNV